MKINNLYNRLDSHILKLDVLFETDCTEKDAKNAWYEFFNHEYWNTNMNESKMLINNTYQRNLEYDDTEEDIENIFPIQRTMCYVKINCKVTKGNSINLLSNMILNNEKIPIGCNLNFYIESTNIQEPYTVLWKVKNNGYYAYQNNCIRGQIFKSKNINKNQNDETSDFSGNHYVECYIIKNGVCIAKDHIDVNIK